MSSITLSPKQQETAETIFRLTQETHYPPTLDEIASSMGITKGTLQYHISALKKKNIITWTQGAARSLRIIDDYTYDYCQQKFPAKASKRFLSTEPSPVTELNPINTEGKPEFASSKVEIPILGQITAGLPLEVTNQAEEYLELDSFFPVGCYALRVKGQSMIDALINDGDVVLVEPRKVANNGEIVVALINGESSTLKRFYKEANGMIRLQPENPYMEAIYVDPRVVGFDIQGVIKGVLRKL